MQCIVSRMKLRNHSIWFTKISIICIYIKFLRVTKGSNIQTNTQYWLIHKCFSERTTHVETEYFPGKKKRLNAYIIGFLGLPKYSNRRCGQCRGATCQAVFAGIPDFTIGSNSTEITKIWVTPNPIRSPGIKKKSFIYKSGIPDFTIGLNSTEIMKISRPLFFPQGQRRFIMSKHVCRTSAAWKDEIPWQMCKCVWGDKFICLIWTLPNRCHRVYDLQCNIRGTVVV